MMSKRWLIKQLVLGSVLVLVAFTPAWADNIYVENLPNGGRQETSVNEHGPTQVTTFNGSGQMTNQTINNQQTGATTTTNFGENGKPQTSETHNAQGQLTEQKTFGEKPTARPETTKYEYDKNGNITKVTEINAKGEKTETFHEYDKEGNLTGSTKYDKDGPTAHEEYDKDGNIIDQDGDTKDINKRLPKKTRDRLNRDPGKHVVHGPDGETTTITHNPDGSIDVEVVDGRGYRRRSYYGRGKLRCPMGDDCMIHKKEQEEKDEEDEKREEERKANLERERKAGLSNVLTAPSPSPLAVSTNRPIDPTGFVARDTPKHFQD